MPELPDLIDRWRNGDVQAARLIYDMHRARVFRLAYSLLNNNEDAEEVAQDTLAYALMHIEQYDAARARFTTWLHTITVSRVRDRQRRRSLSPIRLVDWLRRGGQPIDDAPTPEQWSAEQLDREQVWQAVQQLPPPLREAIVLRYWAGHSFQEMAQIMNCPLGTAQSRVRRGFEQLRDALTAVR